VPPDAVTVAEPRLFVLQLPFVELRPMLKGEGWDSVLVMMAEHPLLSVTVNTCTPAVLVKVPVPEYGAVPPEAFTQMVAVPP